MPIILEGKKLSEKLSLRLKKKISKLRVKPKLVIIQVGDLEESNIYIKYKIAFAEKIGALVELKKYSKSISTREVISDIRKYNSNPRVHGIMVQLPIPAKLNENQIIESINPKKDVDGLTAASIKFLHDNTYGFVPATTKGIMTLIDLYKINVAGKKVVVVGQSALVGRPTALAFLNKKATVTVCNMNTKSLEKETRSAEILVAAAGHALLIKAKHVSKNQTIIDVGINITKNKKVVGDVDYEKVKNKVAAITPVPGGVGPMTVFSLFENLVEAYTNQTKLK